MDRLTSNKGFLLVELCIVTLSLGFITCLCMHSYETEQAAYYEFSDEYLCKQSEAIAKSQKMEMSVDFGSPITWNEDGNVNQARTICFGKKKIIIELGGGRIVFR